MLATLGAKLIQFFLKFRYRIRVFEDPVMQRLRKNPKGVLFLPNHPALIDPFIVLSHLWPYFQPKALIDEKQLERPGMGLVQKFIDMFPVPDVSIKGTEVKGQIETTYQRIVELLRNGNNFVIYPAGRIYRYQYEDLGGNSFVHSILQDIPDIEIVLIRTTGLWGSYYGFGHNGQYPQITKEFVFKAIFKWLASGFFFVPKRDVKVAFYYPTNFPRKGSRAEINQYLEQFYNEEAPSNLYVPHSLWEMGQPRSLPEPTRKFMYSHKKAISEEIRKKVYQQLSTVTGQLDIQEKHHLARDLMMDSLARAELVLWVENEFGAKQESPDAFQTVLDVVVAASGEVLRHEETLIETPHEKWFQLNLKAPRVVVPPGDSIISIFWQRLKKDPHKIILADEKSGVKSFRDLAIRSVILRSLLKRYSDPQLGILLPASVPSSVIYLATLLSNKVPVMVNWTVGLRNMRHSLEKVGVKKILTSKMLIYKLEGQGVEFQELKEKFIYLEDLTTEIPWVLKVWSVFLVYFRVEQLEKWPTPQTGVILFTSGSEGHPKAVPLSQSNLINDVRGILQLVNIDENHKVLGFLPPFHSFGIAVNILLPILCNVPAVYYPNPTDTYHLAKLIDTYKTTILAGTPTFLYGILRAARKEQLGSLRLAVLGAEKCPDYLFTLLKEKCPHLVILEGYGITECSPVISINPTDEKIKIGTVGKVLPNVEYAIVNPENEDEFAWSREGMLLVRGPTIFGGYLNEEGKSPFVHFRGRDWYKTGDVVAEDDEGYLTFKGRRKRFAKIGGEMISLPAIEEVLLQHYSSEEDDGPILAVESLGDEKPDLVLVTIKDLGREEVNTVLLNAGLSRIYQIKKVVKRDKIPVLGTGKVDYQTLKQELQNF